MTSRDIKHYRELERQICIAEGRVDRIREQSSIADRVSGSDAVFPYVERRLTIRADTGGMELRKALEEVERLKYLQYEIESTARLIIDQTDKTIFQMTMEGKKQETIAEVLGLDRSAVSKRLSKYCS